MFTKEMMEALQADAEKISQLTGQTHEVFFLVDAPEDGMNLSDTAQVMIKALKVAYPEAITIEPKSDLERNALQELIDGDLAEMWDMWPNGDRRWMITPAGRDWTFQPINDGERPK